MATQHTAIVDMVERQPDRTLLYPSPTRHYYIIAPKDVDVKELDTVIYEPMGLNFGWYISTQTKGA